MLPFERYLLSSDSTANRLISPKRSKKVTWTISLFQAQAPHSFRRFFEHHAVANCAVPFHGASACISWRANSQCSRSSHVHNPPKTPFQIHLPHPRREESSQVKSDWGPSSAPNITPFTYPTSPVYTLPIYHQRQLRGWLSERAGYINQAHLTENTGIRKREPISPRVCSRDLCLG